ncbi:MAG: mercuric transport protein periplasmic component [Acidobacteria bacterium SCN 69-37]|jgi:mercuric ion binding protein|nr:MAG: mercuric transport protein periplasmic component [Acidobacteria bacterium SCN 69-37]
MKHLIVAATVFLLSTASAWAGPKNTTLNVSNMTCATCPITVRQALTKVKGVTRAVVDFEKKQATVTFDDAQTNVAALVKATTDAGYPSTVAPADKK